MSKKVAVVMGSDSDLDTMRACMKRLKAFGVPFEVHVISAHRTPAAAEQFASSAREKGFGVIIAAVDQKAHASVAQRIELRHELFARHKIRQHIPPFYGRLTDPICQLFFKCQHRARPTSTARAGAG